MKEEVKFLSVTASTVFAVIGEKYDEKLEELTPIRVDYSYVSNGYVYHIDVVLKRSNGELISLPPRRLYASLHDYENKASIRATMHGAEEYDVYEALRSVKEIAPVVVQNVVPRDGFPLLYSIYCVPELGEPEKRNMDMDYISWDCKEHKFVLSKIGKQYKAFFLTKEDAYANARYKYTDASGKESIRVGIQLAIELTDEQKALLAKFEEAARALQEAGVKICSDYCIDFYAFNSSEMETHVCNSDDVDEARKDGMEAAKIANCTKVQGLSALINSADEHEYIICRRK